MIRISTDAATGKLHPQVWWIGCLDGSSGYWAISWSYECRTNNQLYRSCVRL